MKKTMWITVFMSFFVHCTYASIRLNCADTSVHKTTDLIPLKEGEQIPDIQVYQLINHGNDVLDLRELCKNKVLIIDFWHTHCPSCLEAIPKLESLKKEFKDKLEILMVTFQSKEEIGTFLNKYKQITNRTIDLPIVSGDTILQKLFPHDLFPHYVWIDNLGHFVTTSSGDYLVAENIDRLLKKQSLIIETKSDTTVKYNAFNPLFINGNAGDGKGLIWSSVLSKYIKGVPSIGGIFCPDSTKCVALIFCSPIKRLFQMAYNDFLNQYWIPDNRTILEVSDTSQYVWAINGKLKFDNSYCYQLITPHLPTAIVQKMEQKDLERYFNVSARMEKHNMLCWVLHCDDTSMIMTKGGDKVDEYDAASYKLTMKNLPVIQMRKRFIYNLLYHSRHPFIDDTHYDGNVDIEMDDIIDENVESINKAISKYKMHISLEKHDIDMLIISEKNQ